MPDYQITAKTTVDVSGLKNYQAAAEAAATATQQLTVAFEGATAAANNLAQAIASLTQGIQAYTTAVGNAVTATQNLGTAATATATAAATLGTAAAGAVPGITNVNNAVTATGRAAQATTINMFQLYAVLALVKRGLDALDKFRETEEQIRLVSQATGISVEKLAELELGISRAGGQGDQYSAVLARLARSLEIASQGNLRMQDDLQRLGVTAKDPIQALMQISDTLYNTKDRFEAAGVAEQVLGRGAIQLVGELSAGSAALRENMAASADTAAAMARAVTAADELTHVYSLFRQSVIVIAADTLPILVAGIQKIAEQFELAILPVKLFFDAIFFGAVDAIKNVQVLATAIYEFAGGNYIAASTAAGLVDFSKTLQEMKKDVVETRKFIDDLYSKPIPTPPGAGGALRPAASTGNNHVREIEEQAEVAHNARIAAIQRTLIESEIAAIKGSDEAQIELIEDRHARTIALAQEDVDAALYRKDQYAIIDKAEYDASLEALNAKKALAEKDPKNSKSEVARINGEIVALNDKFVEEGKKQDEDVSKAKANLAKTIVAQNREAADESAKAWEASLSRWLSLEDAAATRVEEEQRRIADLKIKTAETVGLNTIDVEKLRLEREYATALDQSTEAQIRLKQTTMALDVQALALKLQADQQLIDSDKKRGVEFTKDQEKMVQDATQGQQRIFAEQTAILAQQTSQYRTFFSTITNGFTNAVTGWLQGERTFASGLRAIWTGLIGDFTKLVEQRVVAWLAGTHAIQAAETIFQNILVALHLATAAATKTVDTTAATTAAIDDKATAEIMVVDAAGVAAANAYAATAIIPIIGPILAPAAASTALAATLAFGQFEQGTPYVPRTGPYILHQGERVVNAKDNAAGGGGGAQFGDTHIHVNGSNGGQQAGIDAATQFQRMIRRKNLVMA